MKGRADGGTVLSFKVLDSASGERDNQCDLDGVRTNEAASIFEAVFVLSHVMRPVCGWEPSVIFENR